LQTRRCFGVASILGIAASITGCAGISSGSDSAEGGATSGTGATLQSGASGSSGSGGVAGQQGTGGAGGSVIAVDVDDSCPSGVDYFISLGGDLPSRRLTKGCESHAIYASVPLYDPALRLEPGDYRWKAFVACGEDAERIEVWRLPPFPEALSAAGFYTTPDGTTYTTCGTTSRVDTDSVGCESKAGTLSMVQSSTSNAVLEGSYAMPVFDTSGKSFAIEGEFRVCAYGPL